MGWALTGLLLMVGALLPWAEAPFGIHKSGMEGDGLFTFGIGITILFIMVMYVFSASAYWRYGWVLSAIFASLTALVVALIDYRDLQRIIDEEELIKAGSGIYLTIVASGLGAVAAVAGAFGAHATTPNDPGGDDHVLPLAPARVRLRELQALFDEGLITHDQLSERQREILQEI
jgi:hypothetical protein